MSTAEETLQRHDALLTHAERIEWLLGPGLRAIPQHRARALLGQHLRSLLEALATHFAQEEHGGYFASILGPRPDLDAHAKGIVAQHGSILADLHAAERAAREGDLTVATARVLDGLHALREHESAERRLLAEAVLQDIAAVD